MNSERFLRKLKLTMHCRFEGHRRLKAKANTSLVMFILFSIIVIAGSLILLVYANEISIETQRFVSLALIIFSVSSLAFQLLEYGKQYDVRSHNMFMSASKLAELRNHTESLNYANDAIVKKELISDYTRILQSHFENHDPVDYNNAKLWVDDLKKSENKWHIFCKYYLRYSVLLYFLAVNSFLIFLAWVMIDKIPISQTIYLTQP